MSGASSMPSVLAMDVHAELGKAVGLLMVDTANEVLMPLFGTLSPGDLREKSPDELVTRADLECEARLSRGLARLLPGATIIGEEAADADPALLADLPDGLCWLIDPLDGTANFATGLGPFGIMVALLDRGVPILSWLLDPRSGRLCHAARGKGAWIGSKPIPMPETPVAGLRIGLSSLLADANALPAHLVPLLELGTVTQLPRCAAAIYPDLATGALDAALFSRTLPWDHAAGALLLSEAGGKVTRLDGTTYCPGDGREGLIAARTPEAWGRIMQKKSFL